MDPKKHVTHTILFLLSAILTFVYFGQSRDDLGGVELSNFRMLTISDVASKIPAATHNDLLKRWRCTVAKPNSTAVAFVEPFGPDSMCRCIRNSICTGEQCETVEKNCSMTGVPSYAQVFAGYDSNYWNIFIAFLYLHIAVMLNMFIETREDEICLEHYRQEPVASNWTQMNKKQVKRFDRKTRRENDTKEKQEKRAAARASADVVDRGGTIVYDDSRFSHMQRPRAKSSEPRGGPDIFDENGQVFDRNYIPRSGTELGYIYLGALGDGQGPTKTDKTFMSIQNKSVRLFVLAVLSVICLVLSSISLDEKLKNRQPGQKCSVETCMTETLVTSFTLALGIVDTAMFLVGWYREAHGHAESYSIFNFGNSIFEMTVWEDVHNTAAFMLLVSSFSTMSGVHDDTTILFDVLIVMFIGFLQSIQHIIMLQREDVITYCSGNSAEISDTFGTKHTVERTVFSYFLYTRLFVFLVIIAMVFVFMARLQPSISSSGFSESWNYYLRNLSLLLSLTPSVISDIGFEIQHVINTKTNCGYSPYVGAHVWRRVVFLTAMIFYALVSLKAKELDTSALLV